MAPWAYLNSTIRTRWIAPDGRHRVEARPREDLSSSDALQRFTGTILAIEPQATGGPVVVTESAHVAVVSFRSAFAYALSAMTIALLLILRRARDVVLILIPLTLAGLLLGGLIGGTVLVENVFAWPGLGTIVTQSVSQQDYALAQAIILLLGAAVLIVNFVVDLLLGTLDRRSTIREA